ncbi:AAA family ATPase [Curvivirga sp.]|uniref:AAA family ATPase n=1 Tax=Curvivirga sp. TaxID=2856848 RepID=UPI003B5C8A9A
MSATNETFEINSLNEDLETALTQSLAEASTKIQKIRTEIAQVIIGQENVVEQSLITVLASGHAVLIGVPGLGKTLLVETLGQVLGLSEKRVQFTPDLMPADILGSEVLEENESGRRRFRFLQGPIFSQLLMADEINRASPRTQSALLQAMQERRVSIAGHYHDLPQPFHVLATQNPLEQEGTYPLPEAQLDRFLMEITIEYPDKETEREIILNTTGIEMKQPEAVLTPADLMDIQKLVKQIPVGESVIEVILELVQSCRPEQSAHSLVKEHVAWGPGPRASQAFIQAARARAVLQGRLSPSIDDVIALAKPILRHRMALGFAAYSADITLDKLIDELLIPFR